MLPAARRFEALSAAPADAELAELAAIDLVPRAVVAPELADPHRALSATARSRPLADGSVHVPSRSVALHDRRRARVAEWLPRVSADAGRVRHRLLELGAARRRACALARLYRPISWRFRTGTSAPIL